MRRQGVWFILETRRVPDAIDAREGVMDAYSGECIRGHQFYKAVWLRPPAWGRSAYAVLKRALSKAEVRSFLETSGVSVPAKVKR
jgi:hypothetical protein